MADTGTGTITSPYDYPPRPLLDPVPASVTVENNEEETREKLDTAIDLSEDKSNEYENKEEEMYPEEKDEVEEDKRETEKPLLKEDDSVKIEIKPDNEGEDTPTLPLPDKKKKSKEALDKVDKPESELPKYLFPITRIKNAWNDSTNIFQFLGNVVCIIFQTVGWFTCVGGIPFLSLVMLIIGSIYVNDCNIEPNIPIYLIVSGVIGTIQHVIVVWTKYVPKDTKGRLNKYRRCCERINGLFHLFNIVWFILGCVWVYGAHSDVVFDHPEKLEYCNHTLYNFSFWILNLSFIFLGLLLCLSMCFLICAFNTKT